MVGTLPDARNATVYKIRPQLSLKCLIQPKLIFKIVSSLSGRYYYSHFTDSKAEPCRGLTYLK